MNLFFKKSAPALALLGLALGSCQPELEAPAVTAGSADFSRYISVGNSLTAGFSDGGLYREGQLNSYPNLLAQQFRLAGGGEFNQPLFAETQANGSGYLRLTGFNAAGSPTTAPVTTSLAVRGAYVPPGGGTPRPLYTKYADPVSNFGVPGIYVADIMTPGYGSEAGNPYFERITPNNTPFQTYLQRIQATVAASNTPTFFTYWLGNNDVLGYATSGGAGALLTNTDTFRLKTNRILTALVSRGAKGLVATIPDVTGVPFFTTVRAAAVLAQVNATPIPPAAAAAVAAGLGLPALPAGSKLSLYVTTGTGTKREATATDLLLLTSSSVINTPATNGSPFPNGIGIVIPGASAPVAAGLAGLANALPSSLVLDPAEQTAVANATASFNTSITNAANARGLAIFDANGFFRGVAANGYATNGVNNTAGFISGNLFSLDGVHPTPRGYAVVANEMLKTINAKYGSTFQGVNANSFRGVQFP